jgi:hypothetical protein
MCQSAEAEDLPTRHTSSQVPVLVVIGCLSLRLTSARPSRSGRCFGDENGADGAESAEKTWPLCPERVVAALPVRDFHTFALEVAVIAGKDGASLSPAQARDAIFGYTVLNDWSARDLQRREMKVGLGPAKGKDFASTLGHLWQWRLPGRAVGPSRPPRTAAAAARRRRGDDRRGPWRHP